jgi:diguanylate cyclase (GGDEF)-like protein/PAS domain S-box-containing protein
MFYSIPKIQRVRGLSRLLAPTWLKRAHNPVAISTSTRLRAAQLSTFARFSRLLAAGGLIISVFIAFAIHPLVSATTLVPWLVLVLLSARLMIRSIDTRHSELVGQPVSTRAVVEAAGSILLFIALWVGLPIHALSHAEVQPPATLIMVIGCAAMALAVPIAVEPIVALAWATAGAVLLSTTCFGPNAAVPQATRLAAAGYIIAIGTSILLLSRTAFEQIRQGTSDYERARANELLVKEYEEQSTGGLWQIDTTNLLTYLSPSVALALGQSRGQLVGCSLPMALGGHPGIGAALAGRVSFANEVAQIETRDGKRWIALSGDPVYDDTGIFRGFRGTADDVTEAHNSQEKMRELASHDVLTSLPNRHSMRRMVERALLASGESGKPFGLLYLDLDGFKPVNDTFGHLRGDQLLKEVAKRLLVEVAGRGTVGRIGGDEFVVLMRDSQPRDNVAELAKRIVAAVSQPYDVESVHVRIGVSVGVAFGGEDATSEDELFRKADLALYDAKDSGRSTVRFFEPRLETNAQERVRLEAELRDALRLNQFELYYQPVVSAETQEVTGFEALLRWNHPARGFVSPAVFIPLAEESGLIGDIGAWALRTACRDAATWPERITVAVNLSTLQLNMRDLVGTVRQALYRARMPASRLELEVTESIFLGDSSVALETLNALRELGCRIALDDFGTGYSSLGYLNKTVFHKLKIDGSFVRAANKDKEMVSIIQAVIALARCFRMTVTAEGVESREDYDRMRELGADLIQGYLFGRPVPYPQATEFAKAPQSTVLQAAA